MIYVIERGGLGKVIKEEVDAESVQFLGMWAVFYRFESGNRQRLVRATLLPEGSTVTEKETG